MGLRPPQHKLLRRRRKSEFEHCSSFEYGRAQYCKIGDRQTFGHSDRHRDTISPIYITNTHNFIIISEDACVLRRAPYESDEKLTFVGMLAG